ncbi:hypothetical protein ELI49_23645 [Rhizobium ruizarguesonis]|uniref:hypothetical protein n=1 Tax=Rhizobium ruizarguesonis TaxID=2081791 RepID=UPI0010326574|nr:hypothetical protein [Rhizobium ruizarguesonis]QIJ43054.1 hypothetical protein G7039_24165 [Rhizobium leguminosarum]NEH29208.1 hypothetical protein [Rhizobium ruizarguesonis]NEJ09038.1 hypothetical protein [Rhizobium ruizarguesonis]NEK07157.1 hypothetical protein [Rhizobium ruizarguesonis]TAT86356.1 hypothetical protein ELI52_23990 [Rhizobium ruizarguesonis]
MLRAKVAPDHALYAQGYSYKLVAGRIHKIDAGTKIIHAHGKIGPLPPAFESFKGILRWLKGVLRP